MGYENKIIKHNYAFKLLDTEDSIDKSLEILNKKEYDPISNPMQLHPEGEITSNEINMFFQDLGIDLDNIKSSVNASAHSFKNLIDNTKIKLSDIKNTLKAEKNRLEDINILCNKYTDFSSTIDMLNKNLVNTNINIDKIKGIISLPPTKSKRITGKVINITGNGYEGNKYVYKNNNFIENISDSANRDYILDDSDLTYYEYSRVTSNNTELEVFPLVNFDSVMAKCSITIKADDVINGIELVTDTEEIFLEGVSTSDDGINYKTLDIKDLAIKNKNLRFLKDDYIFGAGVLSFKDCMYIKLILRAASNTNEAISFIKKNNDDVDTIYGIDTAKRSLIKINSIILTQNQYSSKGQITIENFITDNANSIAIFANEYTIEDIDKRNSIKYILTINGIDYDIAPINFTGEYKKTIRTTNESVSNNSIYFINESIKNATLTINLESNKNYTTPFISNLKILVGG